MTEQKKPREFWIVRFPDESGGGTTELLNAFLQNPGEFAFGETIHVREVTAEDEVDLNNDPLMDAAYTKDLEEFTQRWGIKHTRFFGEGWKQCRNVRIKPFVNLHAEVTRLREENDQLKKRLSESYAIDLEETIEELEGKVKFWLDTNERANAYTEKLTSALKVAKETLKFYKEPDCIQPDMDETNGFTYYCEADDFEEWGSRANAAITRIDEIMGEKCNHDVLKGCQRCSPEEIEAELTPEQVFERILKALRTPDRWDRAEDVILQGKKDDAALFLVSKRAEILGGVE